MKQFNNWRTEKIKTESDRFGHTYMICQNTRINPETKQIEICGYSCRADRKKPQHQCFEWAKSIEHKNKITNYGTLEIHHSKQFSHDLLLQMFMKWIGKNDISIRAACSKETFDLLHAFIKFGQDSVIFKKTNQVKSANELFPHIDRKKFTTQFIEFSQKQFNENEKQFQNATINALALDAWSVDGVHFLEIMVVNSLIQAQPLLVASYSNFPDTTDSYKQAVFSLLLSLHNKGIEIGSIVSDNLIRQVAAISPFSEQSIQNDCSMSKILPGIGSIIHVRCACHTLQLALHDMSNELEIYSSMEDEAKNMIKLFRQAEISCSLNMKCPSYSDTRWNSLFLSIHWFVVNFDPIIEFMCSRIDSNTKLFDIILENYEEICHFLFEALPVLYSVLLPFFQLTEILETDSLSICNVYSYIHMARLACLNIASEINSNAVEIAKTITSKIDIRFFNSTDGTIFYLAHSFSPFGRNDFRSMLDKSMLAGEVKFLEDKIWKPQFIIKQAYINNLMNLLQKRSENFTEIIQKNINRQLKSPYDFNDTMEFESDDELYTFIENPSDLEDELEFERLFKDEGDNSYAEYLLTTARVSEKLNRPVDYHEISIESRQENFLDMTTHLLGEIAVHLGMDSNEVQSSYIHYILCNTCEDLIGRCYCCPLSDFWNFLGGNSIYKCLAEIAKRLLVCPASEACVERRIKIQKKLNNPERSRSSYNLIKSRGVFMGKKQ